MNPYLTPTREPLDLSAWPQYEAANAAANEEYAVHQFAQSCNGPRCPCASRKKVTHAEANARYRARKKESK